MAWGALAALLWLAATLPFLGRPLLQDADELAYARVALAAAVQGRWWPLSDGDRPFYEKPPLQVWLAAATVWADGRPRDAWPYRLWPCLGAALGLGALAGLGALLEAPWAGLGAAALLALQGDWLFHARFFSFDAAFVGLALAAIGAGLWALPGPRRRWWLAGGLLALAVWVKSWMVLALGPAWVWALWRGSGTDEARAAWPRLAAPALAALVVWIALYVGWNGWGFLREEWTVNLFGRALGRTNVNDPQGNLAFYLKWAQRSSPALLPLVLGLPLGLWPVGPGPGRWRFAQAYAWACCVSWALGLAVVKAQTINYSLPLEAGLCLGLALLLAETPRRAGAWALAVLLVACAGAGLRLWPPALSLALGLPLGLALAWGRRQAAPGSRRPAGLALAALLLLLLPDAVRLETRPLDGSAALVALLRRHPPRRPGEPLWLIGSASLAADFYSDYRVLHPASLPPTRPRQACAVLAGGRWIFYPPLAGAAGTGKGGQDGR